MSRPPWLKDISTYSFDCDSTQAVHFTVHLSPAETNEKKPDLRLLAGRVGWLARCEEQFTAYRIQGVGWRGRTGGTTHTEPCHAAAYGVLVCRLVAEVHALEVCFEAMRKTDF
jgi:hypothetical protein